MALTQASIDQLKRHLAEGEFANAEDMNTLKQLIDYEVNIRRKQRYTLTKEIAVTNKQFDTAKYINNLIGGLRKIHKGKFQLVTQNITFIKALFDLVIKIEKLMTYKDQTKYNDNAGCDGECRGLCSGCENSCTGSNNCSFVAAGGGGSTICSSYQDGYCGSYANIYRTATPYGYVYAVKEGNTYYYIDGNGKKTGGSATTEIGYKNGAKDAWHKTNASPSQSNIAGGGGGCNLGTTGSCGGHGWCNQQVSPGGCAFNGGCGAKNYSH